MADKMNAESAQCDTAKSLSENSREATPAKSSPEHTVETMGETSAIQSGSKIDKIDDKEQQPLESSKSSSEPKEIDFRDKIEQGESKVTTPKKDKSSRKRKVSSSSESDDERVEQQRSKSPAHSKTRTSGTPRKQTRENSSATSRKRSRSRSRERSRDSHKRNSRDVSHEHSKITTPKKDESYRNRKVRSSSESDDERVEQQRSKSPAHSKTKTSGSNGTPRKQTRENSSRKRARSRSRERSRDRHERHSRDISHEQLRKRSREEHSDIRPYSSKSGDTHQSPWKEKANNSSENTNSPSPWKSQETLNSVKKTPQKTKNESNKTNLSQKETPPKKEVLKSSRYSPIFFDKPECSRSWRKEDSLKLLKQDWKHDKREHFCFFFGKESPFSNFHSAKFTVDGVTYSCSEQFMMYQKAVLFKDPFHAVQILKAEDPLQMKRFGRKVQNFNAGIWSAQSDKILGKGIKAKFMQNKYLKRDLINTFPRILVEASPRDRLWGIGMGEKNYKAQSRHTWRGKNRLGFLLTNIRNTIMEEEGLFH